MNIRLINTIIIMTGLALGTYSFIKEPEYDIYRIEYELNTSDSLTLSRILSVDTLYRHEGLMIRNFTGSVADTNRTEGICRFELKVYAPYGTGVDVMMNDIRTLLDSEPVSVYNTRFDENIRSYHEPIAYFLSALLIAGVLRFSLSRFKKNGSIQNSTGATTGL